MSVRTASASLLATALSALVAGAPANAADLIGTSAFTTELIRVDSATGNSTVIGTYQLVDPTEFRIPSLARRADGALLGISDSVATSRVYVLNEQTGQAGALIDIATGPVSPVGAGVDPADGSLYWLNTYGFVPWPQLYRMDLGTGAVTFLGNVGPVIQNELIGLVFAPDGNLYSINFHQKALMRLDKNDPSNGTVQVGPLGGSLALNSGAALYFDSALQSLVLYDAASKGLYTVSSSTGAATPIAGVTVNAPPMADLIGGGCPGDVVEYGTGCAGSGGFVPHLWAAGCPVVGAPIKVNVEGGLGGATALLFFGLNQAAIPLGLGCTLNVSPLLPAVISFPLNDVGPGNGTASLAGVVPGSAAGVTFTMQVFVLDGGAPLGASNSNGLELAIP